MNNQCARGTTASVVRNDIKVIDAIILNPEASHMSLARTPIYLSHLRSSQHHILLPCSSRQNMALDGPSQFEKVNKTLGQTPGIHIFLQKVFNKFIQLPALLSFIASGQTLWRFSCSSSSKFYTKSN
ncbi:hypothetical protein ACJQWK_01915 [Exserohilum turcicum]